jgi:hypothetical protein
MKRGFVNAKNDQISTRNYSVFAGKQDNSYEQVVVKVDIFPMAMLLSR